MGYKIISGKYETGTLEQQLGYKQLFGIENIIKSMPSPIPKDKSFREFFKSIWGTEQMNSVMMYG